MKTYNNPIFLLVDALGLLTQSNTSVSPSCRKKATNWGGVSKSPYKKVGPMSVLGRAR